MPKHNEVDLYVYPGTTVLINLHGIRDQEKLDQYELMLYTAQVNEPLPRGQLDYAHLKAIHHHFFGTLYAWAGQERTVDIAKGDTLFAHYPYIASASQKLFSQLNNELFLRSLDKGDFCERLSYYFNEINAIHPFREGNGRTQRAFCDLLAKQANYTLDWTKTTTIDYIQASIEGFQGNYVAMQTIFERITSPKLHHKLTENVFLVDKHSLGKTYSLDKQKSFQKEGIEPEVVNPLSAVFNVHANDSSDRIDWLHPLVCHQLEKLRDDKSESIQGLLHLHDLAKQKNAVSQALKIGLHDTLLQLVENPVLSKRIAGRAELLHKIGHTLSKQLSHKRSP
ncbi:MAG: hypothetical protein HKM04_04520 [Legionellales bacterium]|nr:hypothetical protein [Legionellales bacterium]